MINADTNVVDPSNRTRNPRLRGRLLLFAAALAMIIPLPWHALQTVGTRDGKSVDTAGYETRYAIIRVDSAAVRKGDDLLSILTETHDAAAVNMQAAARLALALLLGLPGAFLVGRHPDAP